MKQPDSLISAYITLQSASGIKPGDTVKVTRKANSFDMGWTNGWEKEMTECVGKTFTVGLTCGSNGIDLIDTNASFPFFVLEKIKPEGPPEKEIYIAGSSVRLLYLSPAMQGDTIVVGLHNFGDIYLSDLKEIVKHAEEFLTQHQDSK